MENQVDTEIEPVEEPEIQDPNDADLISNIAIYDYLDVIKTEYETERLKKQSLESRAGIALALFGTVFVVVLNQVNISEYIEKAFPEWLFITCKIIVFIILVAFAIRTVFLLIKTVSQQQDYDFTVEDIDENLLGARKIEKLADIIRVYKYIVINHRRFNKSKKEMFDRALTSFFCTFIFIIIYQLFK